MEQQEQQAQQPIGLTLQDLRVLAGAIELGSQRGGYRAPEMEIIGATYNKLAAFLKANEPQLYSDLADKYTKLAAKFAPPAPENGTAFDLDSPETWAANPDVLLKAVEAKCKTFKDVSDLDKWFYDNIEFHLADANLFPPDVQQVKDIVDRYLKRHHK